MEIKKNEQGSTVISSDVVEKIAASAACDIAGVAGVVARTQAFKAMLKTQRMAKSVLCEIKDGQYFIDIFVKVKEGAKLSEVAALTQESVKEAVENMTGTPVSKVNVHICDIEFVKPETKK